MKYRVSAWILMAYAWLVLIGGIIGYVKAHSTPSLTMGIIFGAIAGVSSILSFKGKLWGLYLGLASSALLGAFFTYRFMLTHKFMPPGLMAILSVIVVLTLLWNARKHS